MAPVRNIHGLGGVKPIQVIHFIPPRFSPIWKIEIVTETEIIDITELLVEGEYSDGVTAQIGDFSFRLLDPNNTLSNRVEEFDTLNVYSDYGTSATTLRFSGKIESKQHSEQVYLDISGRSIAIITTGTNITYSSNGLKSRSDILKEIIDMKNADDTPKYFDGLISTAGIEDDDGKLEVNYAEIPFWSVVEAICTSGERDAYISSSFVFNYFEQGSRENITEAVVQDVNLIDASDYGNDTDEIYTKVRVYGSTDDNIPIIYSSDEDTSSTKGIVKTLKLDNGSAVTPSQAKYLADDKFNSSKTAPTTGTIIALMTPTILPGEKLKISNPTNNIPPAFYEINSFRHIFSENDVPQTIFTIKKHKLDASQLFKKNIEFRHDVTENTNPRDMDFTIIYDYNLALVERLFNTGTFDNAELEIGSTGIGVLKTSSGETGTWTSDEILTDAPVSIIEIRENSTDLAGTKFFVSLDRGITFTEIGSSAGDFVVTNPQNSIIIKAEIKSSNTRIKKIGIYYKT